MSKLTKNLIFLTISRKILHYRLDFRNQFCTKNNYLFNDINIIDV